MTCEYYSDDTERRVTLEEEDRPGEMQLVKKRKTRTCVGQTRGVELLIAVFFTRNCQGGVMKCVGVLMGGPTTLPLQQLCRVGVVSYKNEENYREAKLTSQTLQPSRNLPQCPVI